MRLLRDAFYIDMYTFMYIYSICIRVGRYSRVGKVHRAHGARSVDISRVGLVGYKHACIRTHQLKRGVGLCNVSVVRCFGKRPADTIRTLYTRTSILHKENGGQCDGNISQYYLYKMINLIFDIFNVILEKHCTIFIETIKRIFLDYPLLIHMYMYLFKEALHLSYIPTYACITRYPCTTCI